MRLPFGPIRIVLETAGTCVFRRITAISKGVSGFFSPFFFHLQEAGLIRFSIQFRNGSLSCCFLNLCLLALEFESPGQNRVNSPSWSRPLVSHEQHIDVPPLYKRLTNSNLVQWLHPSSKPFRSTSSPVQAATQPWQPSTSNGGYTSKPTLSSFQRQSHAFARSFVLLIGAGNIHMVPEAIICTAIIIPTN